MKHTLDNTDCTTWFERDRAHVALSHNDGCEETIFELWDEQVSEFIEDGFKRSRESWHDAMIRYANEHKLTAQTYADSIERGAK